MRRKFKPSPRRPLPLGWVIAAHVIALGVALLLYALPHHVIPREGQSLGLRSVRGGAVETIASGTPTASPQSSASATPAQSPLSSASPAPASSPSPSPEAIVGDFRARFADRFTDGAVEVTENSYRSADLNITVFDGRYEGSVYHAADIYIADIECLATAFAHDTYGSGYAEDPGAIAQRWGSVVALSGDYYGAHDGGIVVRNGVLYRNGLNQNDLCVLYWDGTMRTFSPSSFDVEAELTNGAYQVWCFGPMLLDESGQPMTRFNSNVTPRNPRAAIGFYEPGHYCFVMVEGRTEESEGLSLEELSQLMYDMGCTAAYNLDGGQSAALLMGSSTVGGVDSRSISDIVMVLERTR